MALLLHLEAFRASISARVTRTILRTLDGRKVCCPIGVGLEIREYSNR